jgi:hypothetical protein
LLLALLTACGTPGIPLAPEAAPNGVPIDAPQQSDADWTVDCNGGGDFETLSDAIEAAAENDWIEVAPCTYRETIDFNGKSLWISSREGSATTILDARGDYGVIASDGEGDGTALVGFTIENAGGDYGAVYVYLSALRLEDVVITGARGGYFVVYTASGDLELTDVTIEDSEASYYTMYMSRGAVVADGLTASCEGNSYAFHAGHGSFFVDHSAFSCNRGYAIYNEHSVGLIFRSELVGAYYSSTDEDHYDDINRFENTLVRGDIVQTYGTLEFRNSVLDGGSISATDVYSLELEASVFMDTNCAFTNYWTGADETVTPEQTVAYNAFWGVRSEGCDGTTWSGSEGNIAEDPMFVDADGGDYRTEPGSPLIDAGLEESQYDDPDGSRNDIGLYGGRRSLGGGY